METTMAHIEAVCPVCRAPIRVEAYRRHEEDPWRTYWIDTAGLRFDLSHEHQPKEPS